MTDTFGSDCARDISRVVTALSTIPSSMAGMKIAFGGPTAVHLIGTFSINNFGGLGGGL